MSLNNNENNMINQILVQVTNTLISEDSNPQEFTDLVKNEKYNEAYIMVSPSIRQTLSLDEFKNLMDINTIPNSTPDDEAINNYQESQKIYKDIALKFSNFLVTNDFLAAHAMLSSSLKKEYTPDILEKKLRDMTDYFEGTTLTVYSEFVEEEGAIDDQYIYVPIEEPGNTEAVSLYIDEEDGVLYVHTIEWGRP